MVLLFNVITCFFANAAEQAEMFAGYGNLFDAGVKNVKLFVEMQRTRDLWQDALVKFQKIHQNTADLSKNHEFLLARVKANEHQQEYLKFLNEGITIFKESFKEFISRHNGDIINFQNFREMKSFYAYSLQTSNELCHAEFMLKEKVFFNSLKHELDNERKLMSNPKLFSTFDFILSCFEFQKKDLKEYYKKKDAGIQNNEFQELRKPLKTFCKYGLLYFTFYILGKIKEDSKNQKTALQEIDELFSKLDKLFF